MAASAEEITEEADYDYVGEPVCTVEKIAAPPDQRFRFFTQSFPPIAVCWLILLVIMGLRIHFTSVNSENDTKLNAEIQNLTTQIQQLNTQNQELEVQKNNLTEQIRDMETSDNVSGAQWSINAYCPKVNKERQCKPCQDGWQYFQVSCYVMIYPNTHKWKTWEEARESCRRKNSDLVVIDNAAEKYIISHYSWGSSGTDGYWIGLRVEDGKWKWVDGSDLTNISWIEAPTDGHCAISVLDVRWRSVSCSNRNRWSCKKKALSV